MREEAIARRPSQIQQKQMREEAIARQQSQQIQRRQSRDDATRTEPAKKKTKKPVPELQLEPESPVAQRRVEAYGSVRKSTSASVHVFTTATTRGAHFVDGVEDVR